MSRTTGKDGAEVVEVTSASGARLQVGCRAHCDLLQIMLHKLRRAERRRWQFMGGSIAGVTVGSWPGKHSRGLGQEEDLQHQITVVEFAWT